MGHRQRCSKCAYWTRLDRRNWYEPEGIGECHKSPKIIRKAPEDWCAEGVEVAEAAEEVGDETKA